MRRASNQISPLHTHMTFPLIYGTCRHLKVVTQGHIHSAGLQGWQTTCCVMNDEVQNNNVSYLQGRPANGSRCVTSNQSTSLSSACMCVVSRRDQVCSSCVANHHGPGGGRGWVGAAAARPTLLNGLGARG